MWVSPQGFSGAWFEDFLSLLRDGNPDWLTGVVYGPWIHMDTAAFRTIIPTRIHDQELSGITHTLSCEYPVPDWDVAYAVTEGREVVNPRPQDQATIFRHTQPSTVGFITYSEGCHDDVNKVIWSQLGWNPDVDIVTTLREYSRYFIGASYEDEFAQGILALERNWRGQLADNHSVSTTLSQFQDIEPAPILVNCRTGGSSSCCIGRTLTHMCAVD